MFYEEMGKRSSNMPFIVLILLLLASESRADCTLFAVKSLMICENLASLPSSYPADNATLLEFAMGNDIKNITAEAFSSLENLKSIKLSGINIEHVHTDAFKGLNELETLNLGKNKIMEIKPETFSKLPKLRILRLESNELSELPEKSLPASLESLELDYNKFTEVPLNAIEGVAKLNTLTMNSNKLTSLPILSGIKSLKYFEATDNKLTTVQPEIFKGLQLKELLMNSNPFMCDCNLTAFFQWIKGYKFEHNSFEPEFSEYECDSTSLEPLRGKTFDMFNMTAFQALNCTLKKAGSDVVNSSGKGDGYILSGSTILCALLVAVSALWKIES